MTINLPECMMIKTVGEEKIKFPQIEPGLYCTKDDKCEFDYGAIVFYTQNKDQTINAELSWDIDFYAGIDYMNLETIDDDGDGNDDQPSDGGDGDGDSGDGDGDGDDDNGLVPSSGSSRSKRIISWQQNKKVTKFSK